jgi:putative DNA primase/helicase
VTVEPAAVRALENVGKAREPDVAGDHLNAERFLDEHGSDVRYAPELGRWLVWSGAWWQEDRLEAVADLARQTIDRLRPWVGEASSETELKRRSKHYGESCRSPRRDGMLAIARAYRSVVVSVAQLDSQRHLLACRNGTVDLRTGELLEADRRHLITRGVDVDYAAGAKADEWGRFLERIFADNAETIAYVKRLFGYSITGEVGEHVLPILMGTGGNGKSQFVTAVTSLLGEHAAIAPEGLLVESKHEQHPERLAALRGRRLVVSYELEHRAVLAESLVKGITGGDKISARFLYGQRFDFDPSHTVILVTNFAPRVRGIDEAIWRRLRVVPFTVTIPPAERILDYGLRLAERHGEAILAWLVAGAVQWYAHRLGDAKQVQQATFDYRQREDVFAHFLEESTVAIRGRTPVKDLRAVWREWAKAAGTAVGRDQDFVEWLESHGLTVDRGRTSFVREVGILTDHTSEQGKCTPQQSSSGDFPYVRPSRESYGRGVSRTADDAPELTDQDLERFDDDRETVR